jgi:hypothetical protein
LRRSPPKQLAELADLDAIAAHRDLHERDDAARRSAAYADLCARREIETREQELRAYVVRHSVRLIDCLAAVVVLTIVAGCFGIAPLHSGSLLAPSIAFAALLVAASARSISTALRPPTSRSAGLTSKE